MSEWTTLSCWGVSNENAFGITMLCTTCVKLGCPLPVSCQNDFSILNQTYEEDTYEAAHRFGIVGLPYGALCGGKGGPKGRPIHTRHVFAQLKAHVRETRGVHWWRTVK